MSGAEQSQWPMPARGSKQFDKGGVIGNYIFSLDLFLISPVISLKAHKAHFGRSSEFDL